jgi:hypothetical protein
MARNRHGRLIRRSSPIVDHSAIERKNLRRKLEVAGMRHTRYWHSRDTCLSTWVAFTIEEWENLLRDIHR